MLSVNKLIPQGRGLAKVLLKRASAVELDWDVRCKSRFDATDSSGRPFGVFLPRGTVVRGGDVLVAEDGSLIAVRAAPQPVLVVRHCADHGAPFDLLRAAYHLGNRHVQLELQPDQLLLIGFPFELLVIRVAAGGQRVVLDLVRQLGVVEIEGDSLVSLAAPDVVHGAFPCFWC